MSVQKLTLGGHRFVVLPEKAFRELERRVKAGTMRPSGKTTASDRAEAALARRRPANLAERPIPDAQARRKPVIKGLFPPDPTASRWGHV
jgi:hypothetical protein